MTIKTNKNRKKERKKERKIRKNKQKWLRFNF